jgi:hypothetical protein
MMKKSTPNMPTTVDQVEVPAMFRQGTDHGLTRLKAYDFREFRVLGQ